MREDLFDRPLIFASVYDTGSSLWFTEYDYNALMKMDKKSRRVEWKGSFPGEPFWNEHLYSSSAACSGELYFAPYWAKEIAVYDFKTEIIRKISLPLPGKKSAVNDEAGRFIQAAPIEKKVYFIPAHYPGVLCYDTERERMDCLDNWVDRIEELRTGESWYFSGFELVGHEMILPCACADAIVVIDIRKGKSRVIPTLPTDYACKFIGMYRVGDHLYLVSADGTVTKRRIDSPEEEMKRWNIPVFGLNELELFPARQAGDSLWLFPNGERYAYRLDMKTEEGVSVAALSGAKEWPVNGFFYLCAFWDGSRFYLSRADRSFWEYEPSSGRKTEYRLFLPEEERELLRKYKEKEFRNRMGKEVLAENEADTLINLLDGLELPGVSREDSNGEGRFGNGRNIYQKLREAEDRAGRR